MIIVGMNDSALVIIHGREPFTMACIFPQLMIQKKLNFKLRALFRTDPVESVEFECGDCGEADGEFSQRSTISDGQDLPGLEMGNTAFDGGADTREMLIRFNLGG